MSNGCPTPTATAPLVAKEETLTTKDQPISPMPFDSNRPPSITESTNIASDRSSRVVTASQASFNQEEEEKKPAARQVSNLQPMPTATSTLITATGDEATPKPAIKKAAPAFSKSNPAAEINVPRQFMHSSSVSSDLSAASVAHEAASDEAPSSPSSYRAIPPAPPSTPASGTSLPLPSFAGLMEHVGPPTIGSAASSTMGHGSYANNNINRLEAQHRRLMEEAVTPIPHRPDTAPTAPAQNAPTLPEDFSDWAVGDRYELVRILGRGSYGEVAQAIDLQQQQQQASPTTTTDADPNAPVSYVAIKRIQSPFDQQVDAVRLYRELHILRRLRDGPTLQSHDCIIRLLDVVQPPTDDLDDFHDLYLVFEYVDTDLYKLIMSPQYLTTAHIQTFLYQMVVGIKYVHTFSVIHRDLKPANILLNEDCSLKICDFGLARIVDDGSMSQGGGVGGSASRKRRISDHGLIPNPKRSRTGLAAKPIPVRQFHSLVFSLTEPFNLVLCPKQKSLTRQLTKHVVTRWYRAPELILIQPYTSAVDIWSLGCIFAELLSMQDGNVPSYAERKALFPGGTCYPLSGEGGNIKPDDRLDQLSAIFSVIGTPPPEELDDMGDANSYVKSLPKMEAKSLASLYPASDPEAIDLLGKMLRFNPTQRVTAEEALEHNFFKSVRRRDLEREADSRLEAPSFLDAEKINLRTLKQKIFDEVLWYRNRKDTPSRSSPDPTNQET